MHPFFHALNDERFPHRNRGVFSGDDYVNQLKAFVAGSIALMLVSSATAARAQTATSMIGATESDNAINERLAYQISQAWIGGKDASDAVEFQVRGETALSQGDPQQARHYFEAAEYELTVLQPSPAGAPSGSR